MHVEVTKMTGKQHVMLQKLLKPVSTPETNTHTHSCTHACWSDKDDRQTTHKATNIIRARTPHWRHSYFVTLSGMLLCIQHPQECIHAHARTHTHTHTHTHTRTHTHTHTHTYTYTYTYTTHTPKLLTLTAQLFRDVVRHAVRAYGKHTVVLFCVLLQR